ncbi:hypothetical protein EJ04DRAFT_510082 [Polyplosphaeria fusca]|uniref:Uncharacterized protein n=1 Tax=Polyplosphaeria fusca TaxID=682080 RepID=A0A9P4R6C4_9PLEO|nr:hypothetical protein EJ04DRAFT_510082 [Polyplosphaeria fusca]
MRSLSNVPARALSPGAGVLGFDIAASAVIIACTGICIHHRWKLETRARTLHVGMILLSTWCFFNFIDVVVHYAKAQVTYDYILSDCFFALLKVLSDIFVLWGMLKITSRLNTLRGKDEIRVIRCVGLLLWIVGIYHICLRFALAISWLYLTDTTKVNQIAKAKNGFEIAFQALQFIIYGVTTWLYFPELDYRKERASLTLAYIFLSIRSFCEIVIVGQLDRHPSSLQEILRARNVCYHLFSAFFSLSVIRSIPYDIDFDPLYRKETDAIAFVRNFVLRTLKDTTKEGKKTAKGLDEIFDMAEKNKSDDKEVKMEVQRLKKEFEGWEPIHIWDGEEKGDRHEDVTPSVSRHVRVNGTVKRASIFSGFGGKSLEPKREAS